MKHIEPGLLYRSEAFAEDLDFPRRTARARAAASLPGYRVGSGPLFATWFLLLTVLSVL